MEREIKNRTALESIDRKDANSQHVNGAAQGSSTSSEPTSAPKRKRERIREYRKNDYWQ